ncbi:MAG: metallophosphoesterase, partial [Fimbriimonadaceae bacterium]
RRVRWEFSRTAPGQVLVGPSVNELEPVSSEPALMHDVLLEGLEPDSHYIYRVTGEDEQGRTLESETFTFRTAPDDRRPIRFAIVGDTQSNPNINGQIGERIWSDRPDFFMIVGDLVGTGANKTHWVEEFFRSMRPLLSRIPLLPVLGNHEGDARLYYDYMSLPEPEYYYKFKYGPADFFVIDSQRNVGAESEQYQWLEEQLAASDAPWKFVAHHYPPFSSDEDDHGNLWEGQSTWGIVRMRELTELYERYDVDIVWNGHIHSYERTFPLSQMQYEEDGVIYVICGGGGGGLETPGPTRPWFSNYVRYGHHYVLVSLTENKLEYRAYDVEGRLFDTLVLEK